jgi:hypothetical protein
MRPSQAVGLFVKTWRAEWAGLSRAQLSLLVSRRLTKPLKPGVTRAWEEGQPPGSVEELDALCLAMRLRTLSQPGVGQFRDAALAACLDRHYAGLFLDESFAQDSAADALAEATWSETCNGFGTRNVVTLVAQSWEMDAPLQR